DTHSALYEKGIRPGDIIDSYDSHAVKTAKDHLYAPMLTDEPQAVRGYKVNYRDGTREPFDETVQAYPHPFAAREGFMTLGVLSPAEYLLYSSREPAAGTPLDRSGIEKGDRLFWVDGDLLFSNMQLRYLLNQERALLTVERDGTTFLARAPRVPMAELDFS